MDLLPEELLTGSAATAEMPRRLGPPVEALHIGMRIDRYLAEHFPFLSRHAWQRRIREDRLFVNRLPTSCNYRIRLGDELSHLMPPGSEPEVSDDVQLIYRDAWILAACKPPNLPMHEGGFYHQKTFVRFVRQKFGPQWSPVHRLDLDTSGLVLCTGDAKTREYIASQFRARSIKKSYLFLTAHQPTSERWQVDQPIGPLNFRRYLRHWLNPQGKPAQTTFELVEQRQGLSLVRALPVTGRTLQIRIHAAFSGVPILGDKLCHPDPDIYVGYKEHGHSPELNALTGHYRSCLHSESLQFIHPDGSERKLSCAMAKDMEEIWTWA